MQKIDIKEAMKLANGKSLKEIVRKHKARLRKKYRGNNAKQKVR